MKEPFVEECVGLKGQRGGDTITDRTSQSENLTLNTPKFKTLRILS